MAYPGPGIGPWHVAEVDIHLINDIFKQIEEQINLLRGLRSTITVSGTSGTGTFTIGKHSHETDATGGQISHDTALDDVSADDHHDELHDHSGPGSGGFITGAVDNVEGWLTGTLTDKILAGTGITITEHDESGAITLAAGAGSFNLTVEEIDGGPSVSNVDTIKVTNTTLTDNGGGTVTLDIGTGSGGCDVQWSVLASAAALIFDSNGDVIMTELCQPSSCCP